MFSKEGRSDARKVLVIVSDKKSDSTDNELNEVMEPLQEMRIIVIPVAFGDEADEMELGKLTDDASTLIRIGISNDTADIKMEIMDQVFKGLSFGQHCSSRFFKTRSFIFFNVIFIILSVCFINLYLLATEYHFPPNHLAGKPVVASTNVSSFLRLATKGII